MRRVLPTLLLLTLYTILCSHEFWLEPTQFRYQPGQKASIRFLVGEGFYGDNWNGNRQRVQQLQWLHGKYTEDISSLLSDNKGDSLQLHLKQEGTQVVVFNSTNAHIEMDAAKFTAYLQEDGLKEALAYRKTHNETDSAGREKYQRSVKTIFQVGTLTDSTFLRSTGLPLDIIPLQNPYTLPDGDSLTVRVLFQNKPLAGHRIRMWHRNNNILLQLDYQSDKNGEIRFPVLTNHKWMISTVKMLRLQNDPGADWQSYWGSLTWGY